MIIKYTAEELQHIEDLKREYGALIQQASDSKEKARLSLQLSEELIAYTDSCQRERFKELEGKPAEILEHAQGQIDRLLEIEYKELTAYTTPEDIKKLGLGTVIQGKPYLNANFMGEAIREELHLHIEALRDDKERLQQLFTSIVEAVESSEYTDSAEITISPSGKAPLEVMRYRRRPLTDISTYGIMNDKANAQLLQDSGLFKQRADGQLILQWAVNQAPQTREEVPVYIALTYEGTEGKITKKMTAYDKSVYEAISTRFYYWKQENPQKPLYITPQEIWRTMNGKKSGDGKAKPSKAQVQRICDSLDKMRFTRFYMDISEEIRAFDLHIEDERIISGHIDSYLLNSVKVEFITDKGNTVAGYRISEEPILYTYNDVKNHLLYVPYEMLDTSTNTSDSENVTEFRNYLLQQIQLMKNAAESGKKGRYFKRSNIILLETIYRDTGIQTPEDRIEGKEYKTDTIRRREVRRFRQADRQKIEGILDAWKAKGWIKGYTVLNQNNEPVRERQQAKGYSISI